MVQGQKWIRPIGKKKRILKFKENHGLEMYEVSVVYPTNFGRVQSDCM